MPPSKQARSAQERQKQRLAASAARKRARRRRMQWVAAVAALVLVLGGVGLTALIANNGGTKHLTVTATTTTIASAKSCVGFKDKLPKGAPAVPIKPGPPATSLVTKDLKVGTGAVVPKGASKVTVNYIGVSCSTGKIFDSSWSRNQTFDADLSGGVIQGWIQGIPGMKVGGERLLEIPPALGYGASGSPPTIAANETLFFVVDVVKV
jgi:peptidylprolyl isomerase